MATPEQDNLALLADNLQVSIRQVSMDLDLLDVKLATSVLQSVLRIEISRGKLKTMHERLRAGGETVEKELENVDTEINELCESVYLERRRPGPRSTASASSLQMVVSRIRVILAKAQQYIPLDEARIDTAIETFSALYASPQRG
jgi:broad-specificity NMP kinase